MASRLNGASARRVDGRSELARNDLRSCASCRREAPAGVKVGPNAVLFGVTELTAPGLGFPILRDGTG